MTCLDNQVWKQAQLACNARLNAAASVKGFGYAATGLTGLRGLGFTITGSVDPSSIIGYASPAAPSATARMWIAPPAAAANSGASTPAILASPIDPTDPCSVASQLPCGGPDSCPADQKHFCERLPRQALNGKWGLSATICSCIPLAAAPATVPGGAVVPSAAGGFSHWGLLAAFAVGSGALYLVMRKKS